MQTLPTDIDTSYPDRSPGDKAHQEHHDTLHGDINNPIAQAPNGSMFKKDSSGLLVPIDVADGATVATTEHVNTVASDLAAWAAATSDFHRALLWDRGIGSGAPTESANGVSYTVDGQAWERTADGLRPTDSARGTLLADVGTEVEVEVSIFREIQSASLDPRIVLAWADADNHVYVNLQDAGGTNSTGTTRIYKVVGGTATLLESTSYPTANAERWRRLRAVCSNRPDDDVLAISWQRGAYSGEATIEGADYTALTIGTQAGISSQRDRDRFADLVIRRGA